MSACATWAWCEVDHTDPEFRQYPDVHEKRVTITVGDYSESFLLELDRGTPRLLSGGADIGDVTREPGEEENTLLNISALWAKANDEYEAFVRTVTPTLKRDPAVTRRLAEVEN